MNGSSSMNHAQPSTTNLSLATLGPNATSPEGGLAVYLLPGVLLGVFALYVLAEVWALKRDRRDREMVGATVIPQRQYHRSPHNYMLQFYTGNGRHDGTTANVYCCLHGTQRQTKPIVLRDPDRLLFQRGTLSSFLVTFNRSLHQIKRMHIWHDIAGPDPPWFLERVVVCHLNTGLTWYFEANRWLDVSQGDGTVECILEPETRKSLLGTKRLFDKQLPDNFKNKHMWFSPFLKKERTRFSRVQRVRCVLCLIGVSVLAVSAVFQITRNLDIFPSGIVRLGPLKMYFEDIIKAGTCACVAFACRLLLEVLMRKSKRKSDLYPGETNVRQYLEYCKYMVGKILLLDDPASRKDVPANSEGKESRVTAEKTPEKAANGTRPEDTVGESPANAQDEHDAQKEHPVETLRENLGAIESLQGGEPHSPVTDICLESNEEDMKLFTKKSHPSVESMLGNHNGPVLIPFVSLEGSGNRRDSLLSTIDFQLFSEQRLSCENSDGEQEGSSSDTGSINFVSDMGESLTLDDIEIVQGESKDRILPTGISVHLKNDGFVQERKRDCGNFLPNGSGCLHLEQGESGKSGNLETQHTRQSDESGGNPLTVHTGSHAETPSTPNEGFWKAAREPAEEVSTEKRTYIVEGTLDRQSKSEMRPAQSEPQTVHNIDNAPKLWKALPFPREHVDKHSLKKLSEKSVYSISHAWLMGSTVLCAIIPLAAAAATVILSRSWPYEVITSWLVTVVLTIVIQSVIIETIFLFFHALYTAFWLKRPLDERNLLHEVMSKVSVEDDYDGEYFVDDLDELDRDLIPRPPTAEERREAREKAGRDRELEQVLVMIVFDVLFLLLLLIIGLGNRDQLSYPMRETMVNTFNPSERFMKIKNIETFWLWAKRDLISGVYDVHHKNFLSDKYNSMLGTPTIRQKRLRMGEVPPSHPGTCSLPNEDIKYSFDECRARFVEEESEEKAHYTVGWVRNQTRVKSNDNLASPWSYQTDSQSQTEYTFTGRVATHEGGGYIAKLGFEMESAALLLDDLQANRWIDPYTRTVVFEMSTYNANVNILSVLSLSVEFTPSNGALPRIDIFSFRLYRYLTASQMIFLVCEGIFVAFVVQLIYRTIGIISLEGKSYFASAWNYSDLLLILSSLITIGLYGARANNLAKAIKSIQKDSSVFYGFYAIAVFDNLVAYMSCLVFIVPAVQFLRFLKFNKDFMVFYATLDKIRSDLGGFMFIMFISLFIFSFWAWGMLRTREENYATFFAVVGNMVSLIMGSFNFRIMSDSEDLGPLFTYTFTFVNMFILLNIVLCIISIGFRDSRNDERFQKSEYEVVAFIVYRVKAILGLLPPYIPPPPKIVPAEVSYISQQWILNTRYITQSQVQRLDDFSDCSYCEDFLDDFQILLCASGLAYDDHYTFELLQSSVLNCFADENKEACCVDLNADITKECGDSPIQIKLNASPADDNPAVTAPKAPLKPARITPKCYQYSLRRQLFEESLRNTRRKSLPAMMPENIGCDSGGEHVETFQEQDGSGPEKPSLVDVSVSEADISRNENTFVPRTITKSASEYSMSRPHLPNEALEKYRVAIENELSCGVRQVFVKSGTCSPQPGRKDRGLEGRRWSIEIEVSAAMAPDEDLTESHLSTSEAPRARLKARYARYRELSPSKQRPSHPRGKLTNGSLPSNGSSAGQTLTVPERKAVEPDTINSVIADLLPGAMSDRNQQRRYGEILKKPEEFLRHLTMPAERNQNV